MCIIAIKPAGLELMNTDTIKTMFLNNPDGAGYMYTLNNQVHIRKGFMYVEDLLESLEDLSKKIDLKEIPLILHFRIGTSGNMDGSTCHPFPVSSDLDQLRELEIDTPLGIAHNGVIYDFEERKSLYSDTQLFIDKCVSYLYDIYPGFLQDERTQELLDPIINGSRLAFLDNAGNITKFGDWIETEPGYLYSNSSYIKDRYTYTYVDANYSDYSDYSDYDSYDFGYYDYLEKDILDKLENFKEISDHDSIRYIRCYFDLLELTKDLEIYDTGEFLVKVDPNKEIAIRIE